MATRSPRRSFVKRCLTSRDPEGRVMTYRVLVRRGVSDYLRGLEGLTREGRLDMIGFMDVLRNYGD